MSFFDWIKGRKVDKDSGDESTNVIKFPEPKSVPPVPPVQPPRPASKEHYRIGLREDGMTTLTVMSGDGWGSITLAMNDVACEQLIKMLRATYDGNESAR